MIRITRTIGATSLHDQPRTATVFREYKTSPYKCRVYRLTDASLYRIERLAVSKQTHRMNMEARNYIYNDYTF